MKNSIAVIGGGASGLFAAITAARLGAEVTIVEKNPRIGKKILSTGNGRCNFTNINTSKENYNSDFVSYALDKFPPSAVIEFFSEIGLLSSVEDEGRVYPRSGQASAVLDVLRLEADRLGITLRTEFDVKEILKTKNGFYIVSEMGERHFAERAIVATGGMAAPKSGSDGKGYKLLKKLGHSFTEIRPSLVQIKTSKSIQGVRAHGRVTMENGKSAIGEIQFNNYGISGIPVFGLSKYARKGDRICIDLLPEYSFEQVLDILKKRPVQTMETYMTGILNKSLGQMILKECKITPLSKMSSELTEKDMKAIAHILKNWQLEITGVMPWDNAQVTSGGICLEEINQNTMESRLVKNLYVTGELLDIDGACGGFNLQWAWSSGFVAGSEAAGV